jgi:hypothetical protein
MARPQDPAAAGRDRLRAGHADREQVIDTLKAAFVRGRLAKDDFDLRVGQAFASRTYAELAAVTAGIPAEATTAQPPRSARAQGQQPVLRPGRVIMVATALYAGIWPFTFLVPWPTNSVGDLPGVIAAVFVSTTVIYLVVLVTAVGYMIAGRRERRSGGRPPRRVAPGAGGQASLRPASAGPGASSRRSIAVTSTPPKRHGAVVPASNHPARGHRTHGAIAGAATRSAMPVIDTAGPRFCPRALL